MKNLYYNLSIRSKIFIIFFIIIFVPSIAFIYVNSFTVKILKNKLIDAYQTNLEQISFYIEEKIENLIKFTQEILYNDFLYKANIYLHNISSQDEITFYNLKKMIEEFLSSILFSRNDIISISFKFSSKNFLFNVSRSSQLFSEELIKTLYSQSLILKGKPLIYVNISALKEPELFISRIVYDRNTLKEIGLLIVKINSYTIFESTKFFKNIDCKDIIFSNENKIIFSLTEKEIIGSIISLKNSKDIISLSKKIKDLNWYIYLLIYEKQLLAKIYPVSKLLFLIFVVVISILSLIVNFLYRDILSPINVLTEGMRRVEKGDIKINLETQRRDELGFLIKSFNNAISKINNLIDTVYKAQIIAKDSQIKALQSKINPHFIFNTLEMISWKARFSGADEVTDMIDAFSNILEAHMNKEDRLLIEIEEELRYLDSYIYLMSKRVKNVQYIKEVDKSLLNHKIPVLIIQPIVENVFKHAFKFKNRKGKNILIIKIFKENIDLVILVEDNGKGIEKNSLNLLTSYLDKDDNNRGLANVNKRIKLLFGENYGLTINSEKYKGTSIKIKLPSIQ